jgi:hypothetical protein
MLKGNLMELPDWFVLIREWRARGIGQVGVTVPFMVGALARASGTEKTDKQDVLSALNDIARHPVDGFVISVSYCPNIQAPVLSADSLTDKQRMPLTYYLTGDNGQQSLGFSQNAVSFLCLDCSKAQQCLNAFAEKAAPHVEKGEFSRVMGEDPWEPIYGPFSDSDLQFIDETIGAASRGQA